MRNGMYEYSGGAREWDRREWYRNDLLHREDGPAVETSSGTRYWYRNGEYHREDGPAVEYQDGTRHWFLNSVEYTEEEHKIEVRLRRCGLSTNVPYEWKSTVDSSA